LALSRATEGGNYPFIPVLLSPNRTSSLPSFARQFQGVHLPTTNEVELGKLLQAVLGTGPEHEGAAGRRQSIRLTASPFAGLRAMTEADSDLFFGREAEIAALIETLKAHRLVAIVADSGSGKSSLAQAGLIHPVRSFLCWRPSWMTAWRARRPLLPACVHTANFIIFFMHVA